MTKFRFRRSEPEIAAGAATQHVGKCPLNWWQRLGFLGFCFFLIKGLLWLIVPALVIWWRSIAG